MKPVLGAVWTPKPSDFTEALEKAGASALEWPGDRVTQGDRVDLGGGNTCPSTALHMSRDIVLPPWRFNWTSMVL